jgi:hypothetical protein
MAGACVVRPEQDHTHHAALRRRYNLAEIKIEREDDAVFDESLLEDVTVGEAMQPLVSQMHRVVAG